MCIHIYIYIYIYICLTQTDVSIICIIARASPMKVVSKALMTHFNELKLQWLTG